MPPVTARSGAYHTRQVPVPAAGRPGRRPAERMTRPLISTNTLIAAYWSGRPALRFATHAPLKARSSCESVTLEPVDRVTFKTRVGPVTVTHRNRADLRK